nr:Chain E, Keratin, type II cytoskeletal 7 [Homo sapiens]4XIF_F Chain F, Keratin, type II cytoskeletal 7 [Homo sapiens]4XIF_G Chain G, Keratin, type II cytoskeletal 7 [Homo sapiens]4XIF_H Chain H, Keratin, type II cytoskeletal 7 [Homo sapiens]
GPVFTSRSAAG